MYSFDFPARSTAAADAPVAPHAATEKQWGDASARKPRLISAILPQRVASDYFLLVMDVLPIPDALIVFVTGMAAFFLFSGFIPTDFSDPHVIDIGIGAFLSPFIFGRCKLYSVAILRDRLQALRAALYGSAALFLLLLLVGFATRSLDTTSRTWSLAWLGMFFAGIAGTRLLLCQVHKVMTKHSVLREAIAIVGAGPLADRLIAHLESVKDFPVEVVGIYDDRRGRTPPRCRQATGSVKDLIEKGKSGEIDSVVIALPWSAEARLHGVLRRLKALSVDVHLCPENIAFTLAGSQLSLLGDLPTLAMAKRPLRRWDRVAKRAEDIVLSSIALLVFAPLLAFVALAIKLDSPGPALFRQRRHGFNNAEIEVFKFRTMRTDMGDATGGAQTKRHDPRITRLGGFLRKSSLDELPQLLNVLRGDMSLIGPRPHPVGMKTQELLCHEIVENYAHRHRMKPGISGWAQVNGHRGATDVPEQLLRRVEHDLFYIDNWSLVLDLKIICLTVVNVITSKNAY
jgi:Undecaprenyl-phosphate glucose phosphotransferase